MENEIWKDIPGHPGYQVSDRGNVRSVDRYKEVYARGKLQRRLYRGRLLKPAAYCKTGHLSLPLGRGCNGIPVHQLVLSAFEGPCPEGMEVLHKNGVSTDNRFENLRYGSRTENILDTYIDGGSWRKLTTDDVHQIRDLRAFGFRLTEIAEWYSISAATVSSIYLRRSYSWLPTSP